MEKRLNKYLAEHGVCSRREADRRIAAGDVRVNGVPAEVGTKVDDGDVVEFCGKPVKTVEEKVVLAYYKPKGVTCTERDRFAERTVREEIHYPVRVTYAGRLDRDSEGLLLLTNDGDLIQNMMRGANGHEKEYIVKVTQEVTEEFLEKMGSGIYLEELDVTTRPCRVWKTGDHVFHIVLTQGLNRQIRRMCAKLHYHIVNLLRVRVLNVTLGALKPGEYRELTAKEMDSLREVASSARKVKEAVTAKSEDRAESKRKKGIIVVNNR